NLFTVVFNYFQDWIAGDIDPPAFNSFAQQVGAAALGVRHQNVAAMIDDAAVHFFRDTIVKAAVARFHVIDRNAQPLGNNRRQGAVGVTEDQQSVWFLGKQNPFGGRDDLPYLLTEGFAAYAEKVIGFAHLKLIE